MPKQLIRNSAILLALALALLAAACGGQTPTGTAPAAPTTAPAAAKPTDAPKAVVPTTASAAPAAGGSVAISGPFDGEAKALTGAGATFPQPLYGKWFSDYEKVSGVKVNYQGIGSGGGIKQYQEKTVDFGATDAPMTDEQLAAAQCKDTLHIPTALGAVVVTYSIAGVTQSLNLSGDTVGGIFLGDIKKWNDPKIVAENAGVTLPNADIVVVHRSDGSGTSNAFTEWLTKTNDTWKTKVGQGTAVNWPVGLGGNGNPGVAGEVKNNPNSIGYVELIYALQQKLPYANIKNKAGKFVTPALDSVVAALDASSKAIPDDMRFSIINADGDKSYPVSTPTWLLVCKTQTDKAKAIALTRVVWWATHEGQKSNVDLGYATLTTDLTKRVEDKINSVTVDGQKAFPGK